MRVLERWRPGLANDIGDGAATLPPRERPLEGKGYLFPPAFLARIIHEKCAIKAKPLISFTTMRMGCLMKFFAMKFLAQVFGGLGRFRAVR